MSKQAPGGQAGGGYIRVPGFADGGGHIRGPGSGTSDSILARLSNGEYVVNARAVSAVGVSFMDRLNALSGGGAIKLLMSGALNPKLPTGVVLGEGGPQTVVGAEAMDSLRGYAAGGLSDFAEDLTASLRSFNLPRFEEGGAASAGHYTFDLRTDRGTLRGYAATKSAIDALNKESKSRQASATMNWSPSWRK